MKKLTFLFSFSIFTYLIFSCSTSENMEISNSVFRERIDFSEALKEYNSTRSSTQHEGVIIRGKIKIDKLTKDNEEILLFRVSGNKVFRKYQFQYDKGAESPELPDVIQDGEVVYLGDNLIISDINSHNYYAFVVLDYKVRVTELTPMYGNGLISVVFSNGDALDSAGASCTCDCTWCGFNCEGAHCGTSSASCSCGGDSQSVTCRSCYNAACSSCDDQ